MTHLLEPVLGAVALGQLDRLLGDAARFVADPLQVGDGAADRDDQSYNFV